MNRAVPTLGITGATGFVGQATLAHALAQGWQVRALARGAQAERAGVTWVRGALDTPDALVDMARGCDAVLHIAGVVNAPDRARFESGNVAGTLTVVEALRTAGVKRLIHVSSLAAREPALSDYGASKAKAETIVQASGLDWTMVRPPAIYGPGDRDNLELFRMAQRGVMLLPPPGRLSLIEVSDLARLLLSLISASDTIAATFEPDDGTPGGWTHQSYAKAIGAAVERRVQTIALPGFAVKTGARFDRMMRGPRARLTPDRARYFCHPDWVCDPARAVPGTIWTPSVATPAGLKATAEAYRAAGWLETGRKRSAA